MGELDATYLSTERKIDCVTLSLHNVYGTPCEYKSNRSQVIPSLVYRALTSTDQRLVVWGNGQQGRAFIHVDDVVSGLYLSLTKGENTGTIQLGPNICTSIDEVAETIVGIIDQGIHVEYDTSKPIGDLGRCANYSKAYKNLGWEPKIILKEGLKGVVSFVKEKEGAL